MTVEPGADETPVDQWEPHELQAHPDHHRLHEERVARGSWWSPRS